ncbi:MULTISPECIES: polysaccharide biosynthesis tyrosine autokinase [Burkholderiaceae]|uniref:polysaccharide biosynthesis tyrosine autokinase n=1 Tax=Burkholderiaceae TaxID=119060 RepID=UPI00095BF9B5|nr:MULTISPECIES: polysaccharide biosynthesis tyrosine autokinase [Burkholderiaceae]MCF2135319.1 polysaccharide biosynthesis tyrosine autokinase [Mycetohabitans sp. B3]MCG1040853.1 polysaccharide biosynthesis tyrosine autokinase [Mycetohabitans sp. B7]SIT65237.1 tyrosine-protein kinase Etk/Wzc [Burkholderia sp. b14]
MEARHIDMGYLPPSGASEGLVPRDLVRVITDNLWAVVGIAAVITALASAYAFFATPLYSADTLVQVEVPKQNELADLVTKQPSQNNSSPNGPPTETEMAIVTSRAVLAPVIAQYRLDVLVTPHRFPVLGKIAEALATRGEPSRAWFGLSKYAWGGELVDIAQLNVPRELQDKKLELKVSSGRRYQLLDEQGNLLVNGIEGQLAQAGPVSMLVERLAARDGETFTVERLNEVTAVRRFINQLKVVQVGKETGIVQISYENSDPALATAVANAVTQNYIGSRVTQTQEEASKMLAFINNELPRLRDDLKQAEAQLQSHRVASGSMQATTESQSYLQGSIEFDRQIAALNLQRTQLLDRFTAQSPEVKTVDAQLAQLRAAKGKFESRFDSMPSADRQSADLARDAKVAEEIYVAMVNKAHELSVSRAGTVGNVHVIDTAVQPSTPVKPRRALIISAAIVLGLMLGVLYVISRRYLSQSVSEPEQIEGKLRLPVFGAVLFSDEQVRLARTPPLPVLAGAREPSLHGDARSATALVASPDAAAGGYQPRPHAGGLLAAARPRDVATEALRGIRTMLNSKLLSATNRIVMVTGATPGTGKSFISANLALLYAQAGKRVLLVDADLRRGRLGIHFGLPTDTVGLAELLGDGLSPEQAIHPTSVANLSLLPAGARPGNPSELLAMERMTEQLAQFNERYDLVLVDTPPVLAVADASIVAGYAGATVLVMRENAQTELEVQETLKRLGRAGAQVAGAIFNGMSARRSDRRSYEYIYAYTREGDASAA